MCVCTPGKITRAGYLAVLCFHSLPILILFLPLVSWGGGTAWGLLRHCFVSYHFSYEMLSSLRFRCSLGGVLYLLVTLLEVAVFAVFSKYVWFWEEISTTLLMLPSWVPPCSFFNMKKHSLTFLRQPPARYYLLNLSCMQDTLACAYLCINTCKHELYK